MCEMEIFILLTHTGSMLSRAIRTYTGEPYSHVSIAFDKELVEVYSFGRKKPDNPFFAGFVREDIRNGTFACFKNTTYALYSLQVTESQYYKLKDTVYEFSNRKDNTKYNLLGLLGVVFDFPISRKNSFFCSQFVAYALERSDIKIFNKCPSLITPRDFRTSRDLKLLHTGKLSNYNLEGISTNIA
jgi:hypothetical protein